MAYRNDRTKNRRRYKSRYRSAHSYKQKRSSSQTKAAVLVSVLTFVVISSLVVVFTFGDSIYNSLDSALQNMTATDAPTVAPTVVETQAVTQAPTEAPTEPPAQQNEDFLGFLKDSGMDLEDVKVNQMIFAKVDEQTLTCKIHCYQKDENGVFVPAFDPLSGYIGAEGAGTMVTPYEAKTPTGLFRLEYAFGTEYDPGTAMDYSKFTEQDYWITDPNSAYYNRWMSSLDGADWSTAQWLCEFTVSYPYAIVFNYNRDNVDPNQGCAKFIHVSYGPTNWGGIGLSHDDILTLLYWLNPSDGPFIRIYK
ncbi:MAG: hypothetical protein IJ433_08810 [Ruminococcus sp.]|nr:hypothetical protein [Ruminococcus sp.]